ncbi:MAG: FMN-binding protein [bacterium]
MKEKLSMIIFIVILGTILTTALVAVDNYTAPIIARNEDMKQKESILKAFEIFHTRDDIEKVFRESVTVKEIGQGSYYISKNRTIAFLIKGAGLWGPIEGVLSMKQDMKTISRLEIIRQEETPGLGSRIAERGYLDAYKNKMFAPYLEMVPEGRSSRNNEIDSITGATMSCKAFTIILNNQYKQFKALISGE